MAAAEQSIAVLHQYKTNWHTFSPEEEQTTALKALVVNSYFWYIIATSGLPYFQQDLVKVTFHLSATSHIPMI